MLSESCAEEKAILAEEADRLAIFHSKLSGISRLFLPRPLPSCRIKGIATKKWSWVLS